MCVFGREGVRRVAAEGARGVGLREGVKDLGVPGVRRKGIAG